MFGLNLKLKWTVVGAFSAIGRIVQFHVGVPFEVATVNVMTLPPNMAETIVRKMDQLT